MLDFNVVKAQWNLFELMTALLQAREILYIK